MLSHTSIYNTNEQQTNVINSTRKERILFPVDKPAYKSLPEFKKPFIDFLSVTYDKNDISYIIKEFEQYLPLIGAKSKDRNASVIKWRFPDKKGELSIWQSLNKIEISGKFLHELRNIYSDIGAGFEYMPAYENIIALLSEKESYRITRCDVSMDVQRPFNAIRTKLVTKCNKTPNGLSFIKGKQVNDKGDQYSNGDWRKSIYSIGTLKQTVSGLIYNKALEQLQKEGIEIDTRSRYEIRVCYRQDDKLNVSLQDCLTPDKLFYHYAHVLMLPKPANVGKWVSSYENKRIKRPKSQSSIFADDQLDTLIHNTTADLFTVVDNNHHFSRVEAIQKIIDNYNHSRTNSEPELSLIQNRVLPYETISKMSLKANDTNGSKFLSGGRKLPYCQDRIVEFNRSMSVEKRAKIKRLMMDNVA